MVCEGIEGRILGVLKRREPIRKREVRGSKVMGKNLGESGLREERPYLLLSLCGSAGLSVRRNSSLSVLPMYASGSPARICVPGNAGEFTPR
jgi:hypothetical protein